jgi:enoyl-[acyl-carrier-protein] reductase (NADH)
LQIQGLIETGIPPGRLAESDEVANLVALLCSPEVSYIHGSIVHIYGGLDAKICPDRFFGCTSPILSLDKCQEIL